MASLPTAYASQRFGRKSLDFYAAAGDVIGADPRARADERRLQDLEGARHTVRLMESGFRLEPGDQASVLRMQPGPARRSRPVAVVNHTNGSWSRTHPGAAGLLARAGVARTWNWALTLTLFAVAALAAVWPFLRAFLVEIDPALFGDAPQFDVFALAAGASPALADWRIAELTAGLSAQIAQVAPGFEAYAPQGVFGGAVLVGALAVYALRSWRLIWAPVFIFALGAGAMGFDGAAGAVMPALAGLGGAAGLFLVAGLINRVRDAARLERRIAILADHILRNPAEEMVAGAEPAAPEGETDAESDAEAEAQDHGAAPAAAAAAAYRSRDDSDAGEAVEAEPDGAAEPETETQAEPGSDAEPHAAEQDAPAEEREAASQSQSEAAAGPGPDADDTVTEPGADSGEAEGADTPNTFEQEESERLRTDPRYASRAIVLPPPPPMPGASDESTGSDAPKSQTRTLQPDAPLPSNVVPMFAAPAPERKDEESVD